MVKPRWERSLITFPQEQEKIEEFDSLCREYWKPLKYFIFKEIEDAQEAEDKVSESLLQFVPQLGKYNFKEAGKYIFGIARNLCKDYRKGQKSPKAGPQKTELKENFDDIHDPDLESSMFEALFQAKYNKDLVKEELKNLTPQQQNVLHLLLEDKEAEEIAAILKISINTVYQHRKDGLNRIRKNLAARGLALLLLILFLLTIFHKNNSVSSTTENQKSSLY